MDNIILIGYMGSGKSTVGKALANAMNLEFLDTDQEIERRQGCSICDIFEQKGELYFRMCETELLKSLITDGFHGILATGGGMPLKEENLKLLSALGKIFYLQASAETIFQRVESDESRPLLNKADKRVEIEKMLSIRTPIYHKSADVTIDTEKKTFKQIMEEILNKQLM